MPCACSGVATTSASTGAPAAPAPEAVAAPARGIAAPSNDARIGSSPAGLDPIRPTGTDSAVGNTSAKGTPRLVGALNTCETAGSAPAIPVPFARDCAGRLPAGLNAPPVASGMTLGPRASVRLGPDPGVATRAVTLSAAVGTRGMFGWTPTREPEAAV